MLTPSSTQTHRPISLEGASSALVASGQDIGSPLASIQHSLGHFSLQTLGQACQDTGATNLPLSAQRECLGEKEKTLTRDKGAKGWLRTQVLGDPTGPTIPHVSFSFLLTSV